MSPTGLLAREMLKLEGQTTIAWAVFDPAWYLARYPEVREEIADPGDDAAMMAFYLEHGQRRGHSPNIFFDEAWHLKTNLGAAKAVAEGHARSAFDTYCHSGFSSRSPHWLFHEALYRLHNPDLTDDVLAADGHANGYDHYLQLGFHEGRIGHLLFDPSTYHTRLDETEAKEADALGPFLHYLRRIETDKPELATSSRFDPTWYLRQYPAVAEAIARGTWRCALHHYCCNDTPTAFDPVPEFSEAHYLARNPDVAGAVADGTRRNGYQHFLLNGAPELRSPSAAIDLRYYVNAHPSVRSDLEQGRLCDAFTHYLAIGRAQGLAPVPPLERPVIETRVTEAQAKRLVHRNAQNLLPLYGRVPLDFTCRDKPALSVVMVLCNQFALTMTALASLRGNFPGDIELILIDSGSTDATSEIGRFVLGARLLRFDMEIDVLRGSNAGLQWATAEAVLLLNGDTVLAPGAIPAALRRLASDPSIAAVGSKVIRADGTLQEAGGIIWRDGVTIGYLDGASPLVPEANFLRDVDFCSAVCLMLRATVAREVEGFDEAFVGTCHEDVDLCLRIADAGRRVVYDPSVVVIHHAAGGIQEHRTTGATIETARDLLCRNHADYLRFRYIADKRVEIFARSTDTRRRILFIEDLLPLRHLGSGFVRSNDLIQVMASLGYDVTVFPVRDGQFDLAGVYADMPDTAEVMHDRSIGDLEGLLNERHGYYDMLWIARTHNLDLIKPIIERTWAGSGRSLSIVLDTEAIAAMRDAGQVALAGEALFDLDAAIKQEFVNARCSRHIIAVNHLEAQKLRDVGFSDVSVIGHMRDVQPTPRDFTSRAGMLFVGAIHEMDSPNYDGLDWFVAEVLPLVEQALGWETRLTVVGYTDNAVTLAKFRDHPRVTLRGMVADTAPLYDAHRLFVAPTRYAAGTPYKIHEAASFGLPVVATELLRRQLGWENGHDLLSADATDPKEFSRLIITLYRDAELWQQLRDNALERVRQENGRANYENAVRAVLEA